MTADPVAVFLADRPALGLSPAVYEAEKVVAAWRPACPQLEHSHTVDQLSPDLREKAVEAVLAAAGDYNDLPLALAVLAGFRPDLTASEVREAAFRLYDLAAEVSRHCAAGRLDVAELFADRYADALADFAQAVL